MKNINIKKIIKFAPIMIFVVAILFVVGYRFQQDIVTGATGPAEVRSTNTQNPYSTTTRTYTTGGTGTSTLAMFTESIEQIDFNFLLKSSSTPPQARWRYEYSENGLDWFADDNTITANATTTVVTQNFAEFTWNFASSTAGTSNTQDNNKHVRLKDINSKYTRIVFYLAPGSPAADVWIQARLKTLNPI